MVQHEGQFARQRGHARQLGSAALECGDNANWIIYPRGPATDGNFDTTVLKADTPLYDYAPGTWGPREVDRLVAPPGGWQDPSA